MLNIPSRVSHPNIPDFKTPDFLHYIILIIFGYLANGVKPVSRLGDLLRIWNWSSYLREGSQRS